MEKKYDIVERTIYLRDGREIKWPQSWEDEHLSYLDWFARWSAYAESMEIDLSQVRHEHEVKYIKVDEERS